MVDTIREPYMYGNNANKSYQAAEAIYSAASFINQLSSDSIVMKAIQDGSTVNVVVAKLLSDHESLILANVALVASAYRGVSRAIGITDELLSAHFNGTPVFNAFLAKLLVAKLDMLGEKDEGYEETLVAKGILNSYLATNYPTTHNEASCATAFDIANSLLLLKFPGISFIADIEDTDTDEPMVMYSFNADMDMTMYVDYQSWHEESHYEVSLSGPYKDSYTQEDVNLAIQPDMVDSYGHLLPEYLASEGKTFSSLVDTFRYSEMKRILNETKEDLVKMRKKIDDKIDTIMALLVTRL